MKNMIKIRDVSAKYDITARTLRYYEDMGLIGSVRSDDYAYRLYDETAIKRLEQILILRKLNISIKDIQRIFSASGSDVVLDVLGKKVQNIDDEVALLHELKEIVLEFIREIERINFGSESGIRLLYDKAKEIENHLISVDYIGKPSKVGRLLEVTEKLEKKPDIKIIALPVCRMVTSGVKQGDNHKRFQKIWRKLDGKHKNLFPCDFMWWDAEHGSTVWWYAVDDWVTEADTEGFGFVDFQGGLYASAIAPQNDADEDFRIFNAIKEWVTNHENLELDDHRGHDNLFHVISPEETIKLLGYRQYAFYVPIRIKEK
jgi:DNA-binding transcriptional MerR regulator